MTSNELLLRRGKLARTRRHRQRLHGEAEWVRRGDDATQLAARRVDGVACAEEYLWACTRSNGAAHMRRQEGQADLVRSCPCQ